MATYMMVLRLAVDQWETIRAGLLDLNVQYREGPDLDPEDPDDNVRLAWDNLRIVWAIEDLLGWDRTPIVIEEWEVYERAAEGERVEEWFWPGRACWVSDEMCEAVNAELVRSGHLREEQIDWRDPNTLWVWLDR